MAYITYGSVDLPIQVWYNPSRSKYAAICEAILTSSKGTEIPCDYRTQLTSSIHQAKFDAMVHLQQIHQELLEAARIKAADKGDEPQSLKEILEVSQEDIANLDEWRKDR